MARAIKITSVSGALTVTITGPNGGTPVVYADSSFANVQTMPATIADTATTTFWLQGPGRYTLSVKTSGGTEIAADNNSTRTVDVETDGTVAALNYDARTLATVSGDSGHSTASSAASLTFPDGVTTTTIVPRQTTYDIRDYGAKVDAVTLSDGVTASGTVTLTSASAGFTVADVGKRVVVCNAAGAGVHLYTTILARVSATQVTLAANATATIASGAIFSYGTDDLAAWTAADAAMPKGGTLVLPGRSLVFGAVTITKAYTIQGLGVDPIYGPYGSGAGTVVLPTVAPYLAGSVLVQAKSGEHGFTGAQTGEAVHFRGVGVFFAGLFASTGDGFFFRAASRGSDYDQGLAGFRWDGLHVMGHDSTHDALHLVNPFYGTLSHLWSFGGGGYQIEQNNTSNPYGNLVFIHPYHAAVKGSRTAHLYTTTAGPQINLIAVFRPQCINGFSYLGTAFSGFGLSSWTGKGIDSSTAGRVHLTAPDLEGASTNSVSDTTAVTPGGYTFTVQGLLDAAPFMHKSSAQRRVSQDGTVSIDSAESAGGAYWLLKNNASATTWAISTDGTERLWVPGTLQATGKPVSSAVGAGIGTAPPPVLVQGTDLSGQVLFGSGTSPSAAAIGTFTFSRTFAAAPAVLLTPINSATQALGLYVSASTTTTFTVSAATAPAASQAVNTYGFSYVTVDSGGQPAVPVVFESGDKADNATSVGTPQIGSAPTAQAGTWGILSNSMYRPSGGSNDTLVWASGKSDCTVSCKITNSTQNAGICWRASAANTYFYISAGGLWRQNAGSFSQLATLSPNYASGDTVSVVLLGTSHKVYVNGVQAASVTDALNQTTQSHGITGNNSTARWDDFKVI